MIFEMGDEIKYYKPMIIELNKMIFHIQKQIYYSDTITRENPAIQAFEWGICHVIAFDRFKYPVTWKIPPSQIFNDQCPPILGKNQRHNFDLGES